MPKGRHLKPDFFTDKNIVCLSPLARLLYQGLWCYAADCGHLDDEPLELKMRILPADNCDVDVLLDELADRSRIVRANGVLTLPKLGEHQRPDKRYATMCEACKARRDHDAKGSSEASPPTSQPPSSQRDHDVTTTGPQRDHDADGDGDGDGDGELMRQPTPRKRAAQLPDTWQPNEQHRVIAVEERRDLAREATLFRDHFRAKGEAKKDWDAAFRNWLRGPYGFRYDTVRHLPHASEIESPPDGLTEEEYAAWDAERRARRRA